MTHETNIKRIDLIIGLFFTNMSTKLNQIIYIIIALLLTYQDVGINIEDISIFNIVLFISIFILYLLIISMYIFLSSIVYSLFSSGLKEGVLCRHEFKFNDENFIEKTEYNESTHDYKAIKKVITFFSSIYILLAGSQWHILPKRDFKNEEDRQNLLNYIREKIEK